MYLRHPLLPRAAALALAAAGPAALAQNLVVNGSFESPGNGQTQVSTVPDGWSLIDTANGVDIIGAGLGGRVAADGLQFLDLIGGGRGAFPSGVYPDLALTAGTTYRLQFAFNGAIYDDGSPTPAAVPKANVASPWQVAAVTFTAQATGLHRLSFSTDSGAWGSPYVDAVSVTAVPEPGTWAMAAAGLPGLGAWRRRAASAA
jgi:hypothetical protein